jgi:DMSO/TMAO reductase YedYZ molybdopterin-dependent catalytic subunit
MLLAGLVMLLANDLGASETGFMVAISGDVPNPGQYSLEQLRKLPIAQVKVRDHDGSEVEYAGVTVEELLRRAGAPMGEKSRGPAVAKAVVVRASDNYRAVFSLAELDSSMNPHPALLAWLRNGAPLPASQGPLRLVVPADKRQTRWVRQVLTIEVLSLTRSTNANVPAASPAASP